MTAVSKFETRTTHHQQPQTQGSGSFEQYTDEHEAAIEAQREADIARVVKDLNALRENLDEFLTQHNLKVKDNSKEEKENVETKTADVEIASKKQRKIFGKTVFRSRAMSDFNIFAKMDKRLSMEGLIIKANKTFDQFLLLNNDSLDKTKTKTKMKLPNSVYGIVFLTTVAGGIGAGAHGKFGIVLFKIPRQNNNENTENENNKNNNNNNGKCEWSHPCALAGGGVTGGIQIGFSKIDQLMILTHEKHVKTFMGRLTMSLGATAQATMGRRGSIVDRSRSLSVSDKHSTEMVCCTLKSKGLLAGIKVSLSGMAVNSNVNKKYFNDKKITIDKIYNDSINQPPKIHQDYVTLVEKLNKYFPN